jgi:hypothetical protein
MKGMLEEMSTPTEIRNKIKFTLLNEFQQQVEALKMKTATNAAR